MYAWSIFALILLAGTSCQKTVNVEKEKEAIMALLQEETDATIAMDLDRIFALHVQDDMETRLELGVYGFNTFQGWDEIKMLFEDAIGGWEVENPVNSKENVIIKVTPNSAWLTCDNLWTWSVDGETLGYSNIQVLFLEKIKGDWKISFASYYSKSMSDFEVEMHAN